MLRDCPLGDDELTIHMGLIGRLYCFLGPGGVTFKEGEHLHELARRSAHRIRDPEIAAAHIDLLLKLIPRDPLFVDERDGILIWLAFIAQISSNPGVRDHCIKRRGVCDPSTYEGPLLLCSLVQNPAFFDSEYIRLKR
jgi:hypothetical protein